MLWKVLQAILALWAAWWVFRRLTPPGEGFGVDQPDDYVRFASRWVRIGYHAGFTAAFFGSWVITWHALTPLLAWAPDAWWPNNNEYLDGITARDFAQTVISFFAGGQSFLFVYQRHYRLATQYQIDLTKKAKAAVEADSRNTQAVEP